MRRSKEQNGWEPVSWLLSFTLDGVAFVRKLERITRARKDIITVLSKNIVVVYTGCIHPFMCSCCRRITGFNVYMHLYRGYNCACVQL
jgi:hypothetical protein